MTTLTSSDGKSIQLTFHDIKFNENNDYITVNPPTIECDDIIFAEYLQEKVNTFVTKLSKKLLNIK